MLTLTEKFTLEFAWILLVNKGIVVLHRDFEEEKTAPELDALNFKRVLLEAVITLFGQVSLQLLYTHLQIGGTVQSQYLELGYLEFCETQSVYLNQKYILIAFSNHDLELETFLQV